jgi:hypothetical protein
VGGVGQGGQIQHQLGLARARDGDPGVERHLADQRPEGRTTMVRGPMILSQVATKLRSP